MTTNIVLIIYGLFLILGGFMGFKKGSKISLIMGVGSGILVLVCLYFLDAARPYTNIPAWFSLAGLTVLLSLSFLLRLIKTRKFMPSGMLLLITLAVLVFCLPHLQF